MITDSNAAEITAHHDRMTEPATDITKRLRACAKLPVDGAVTLSVEAVVEAADALDERDTEIERLRAYQRALTPVMIGDAGHYVTKAVAAEIERLRAIATDTLHVERGLRHLADSNAVANCSRPRPARPGR